MTKILLAFLLLTSSVAFAEVGDSMKVVKKPMPNKELTQAQITKKNEVEKKFSKFAKDYKGVVYDLEIVDPVGRIYELGQSQLKPGVFTKEIDVSKLLLNPGVYFLRIHSDAKQTEVIKFMVE